MLGEAEVARFLVADEYFPGSILRTLGMARENLRSTRETLPSESWEKLNALYGLVVARGESATYRRVRNDLMRTVIEDCLTIVGMLVSNMSRGTAFQFLRLGMAIEQADICAGRGFVRVRKLAYQNLTLVEPSLVGVRIC